MVHVVSASRETRLQDSAWWLPKKLFPSIEWCLVSASKGSHDKVASVAWGSRQDGTGWPMSGHVQKLIQCLQSLKQQQLLHLCTETTEFLSELFYQHPEVHSCGADHGFLDPARNTHLEALEECLEEKECAGLRLHVSTRCL